MDRTADIIAFIVVSIGCALLGWAALHVAAHFEQQRAIHLLEKYGPSPNQAGRPRQPQWVRWIGAALYPHETTP